MSTVQMHTMRTQIIQVPYDSGHKNYRMGLGPGHIVRYLKSEHFPLTEVGEVEVHDGFALEITAHPEALAASRAASARSMIRAETAYAEVVEQAHARPEALQAGHVERTAFPGRVPGFKWNSFRGEL